MAESKNVSDLPLDVSIRWAEDQKLLEETKPIIADSGHISSITVKDVSAPSVFSQLDVLLDTRSLHPSWALFTAPKDYYNQRKRIFTSRILPLFDSEEKLDDKIQKINSLSDKEEEKDRKKEREILVLMLQKLMELNKNLIFVLSRRNQYQKG